MNVREPDHPVTKTMQIVFVVIMMPVLVGLAWWHAPQFDPYTMRFFTRTYVAPTPELPGEMRIFGWVMIGIAALLAWVVVQGIRKKVHQPRDTILISLMGLEIAAFGGAFFVAADTAQTRIEQEQKS